jgi:hypothetical protein
MRIASSFSNDGRQMPSKTVDEQRLWIVYRPESTGNVA